MTGTRLIDFCDFADDGPLDLIGRGVSAHVLLPSEDAVAGRSLATLDGAGTISLGLVDVSKSILTWARTPSISNSNIQIET